MKVLYILCFTLLAGLQNCTQQENTTGGEGAYTSTAATGDAPLSQEKRQQLNTATMQDTVVKTEEEWRKQLTREQYYVLREQGTERPFSNKYDRNKQKGNYYCAGCGNQMFSSATKFDSGTGWPSFWQPISPERVKEVQERSLGMVRTEVVCARCGGHLGHVFDDGPKPTGLRYCLNSAALEFRKE